MLQDPVSTEVSEEVSDTGCQCPRYLAPDGRIMPYVSDNAALSVYGPLDWRERLDAGDAEAAGPRYQVEIGNCGDVNGDGIANITDGVYIIMYLFDNGPPPNSLTNSDINLDGVVNLSDVVQLIGYIFAGYPGPCAPPQPGTVYVVAALDTEPINLWDYPYQQTLNLSNYSRPGPSVLTQIMNPMYRSRYTDSFGGNLKFTFYLMSGESICQSTSGCNAIFNAMRPFLPEVSAYGDELAWHLHNTAWRPTGQPDIDSAWSQIISFNGIDYGRSADIDAAEMMLSRLLVDDGFFPTNYRAGWVWENTDFSNWIDDIMPFDFSSLAPLGNPAPPPYPIFWNYYDWTRAPRGWQSYHPDPADYQSPGNLKRTIFYCSCCGFANGDFDNVFKRAAAGENVYLCLYGHTYHDLDDFFSSNWQYALEQRSANYNVKFKFATAREAACGVLGRSPRTSPPVLTLTRQVNSIEIKVDRPIYQWLPYCALKRDGRYVRVYPTRTGDSTWSFETSGLSHYEFAVGVCDASGKAATAKLVQ